MQAEQLEVNRLIAGFACPFLGSFFWQWKRGMPRGYGPKCAKFGRLWASLWHLTSLFNFSDNLLFFETMAVQMWPNFGLFEEYSAEFSVVFSFLNFSFIFPLCVCTYVLF